MKFSVVLPFVAALFAAEGVFASRAAQLYNKQHNNVARSQGGAVERTEDMPLFAEERSELAGLKRKGGARCDSTSSVAVNKPVPSKPVAHEHKHTRHHYHYHHHHYTTVTVVADPHPTTTHVVPSPPTTQPPPSKHTTVAPPPPKPTTTKAAAAPPPPPPPKNTGAHVPSSDDITAYLKGHNDVRKQHGADPLVWNQTLSDAAYKWASNCLPHQHSGGTVGPYGENIADGSGAYPIASALVMWANEAPDYKPAQPAALHFTQMVWKNTKQVGCNMVTCAAGTIFDKTWGTVNHYVCEYFPPGNFVNPGAFEANVQV